MSLPTLPSQLVFNYDSKWAANAVRGTARPKRHTHLVGHARSLHYELQKRCRVQWQWIKGHSGNKFNDMADQLAAYGKTSRTHEGGRSSLAHLATPQTFHQPEFNHDSALEEQNRALVSAFLKAEKAHLPTAKHVPTRPWITDDLAAQTAQVKALRVNQDPHYHTEYKELKKHASKLKRHWMRDQFLADN